MEMLRMKTGKLMATHGNAMVQKVKVNDEGAYLCKMYYKLMNQNSADERFENMYSRWKMMKI